MKKRLLVEVIKSNKTKGLKYRILTHKFTIILLFKKREDERDEEPHGDCLDPSRPLEPNINHFSTPRPMDWLYQKTTTITKTKTI